MNPRSFVPNPTALVPVLDGSDPAAAIAAARALATRVVLLGLVPIAPGESLSAASSAARPLRARVRAVAAAEGIEARGRVRVSQTPWRDVASVVKVVGASLIVLQWDTVIPGAGGLAIDALAEAPCDLAIVRGSLPARGLRVLVPLRGGPYAELALRVGIGLNPELLTALHIVPGEDQSDAPFRGLERVLANLPGIDTRSVVSTDAASEILDRATRYDVIVMGATADASPDAPLLGHVGARVLADAPGAVIVVRTRQPITVVPTDESAGVHAISILVDKWFAENTFDASEFADLEQLVERKRERGLSISLALPALNEAETIANVIQTVRRALVDDVPLIDEIVVIDSDSTDRTREIAAEMGVPVFVHQHLLPDLGARVGKGDALWKSLLVTRGDIVAWIDTDIVNIHPRFVYGIIGPLLLCPAVQLVKGFYRRPLRVGDTMQAGAGGRVTELMARPMINLFYPELSGIIQPLSGEYAGRRTALERVPFFTGYGVETGLLLDVLERHGLAAIAQVNLLERIHHNQPLEALSKMSFEIAQVFVRRLERRYDVPLLADVNKAMKLVRYRGDRYSLAVQEIVARERPPMIEVPIYRASRGGPRR